MTHGPGKYNLAGMAPLLAGAATLYLAAWDCFRWPTAGIAEFKIVKLGETGAVRPGYLLKQRYALRHDKHDPMPS